MNLKTLVVIAIVVIIFGSIAGIVLVAIFYHGDPVHMITLIITAAAPTLVSLVNILRVENNTAITVQTKQEVQQDLRTKMASLEGAISVVKNKVEQKK